MKSPLITTERCKLRPFKKEDALLWQIWDTDSETQMHMPEPENEAVDISEQYEYIEECEEDEEGYYWSIETLGDEITIGIISLTEYNPYHKTAEIGMLIGDKNFLGKGVATEVTKALIEYVFTNLDLDIEIITAEAEEANIPMKRVFEKSGFVQDGLFEKARVKKGKRVSVLYFSISK